MNNKMTKGLLEHLNKTVPAVTPVLFPTIASQNVKKAYLTN